MDDLISRQAAMDALKEHRALYCDNTPDSFSKLSYAEKCRVDELDTAIATLVNLPSAQPERKKGKWIRISDEPFADRFECSECNKLPPIENFEWRLSDYCPNCGADMRGEAND